jgi:predicted ArsR family transcriptional regulator
MSKPTESVEQRILRVARNEPYFTVREIAERVGVSRDVVKPVLAEHLAQTGGTRLPALRKSIARLAGR